MIFILYFLVDNYLDFRNLIVVRTLFKYDNFLIDQFFLNN